MQTIEGVFITMSAPENTPAIINLITTINVFMTLLLQTDKSDIGVRRPSIVMDVTVWAEVNNSNRPLFIQSIKNAWTTFLNSESETMDFL